MSHWLIKTEHGYILEDMGGNLLQWFDMAVNCKAYCMEQGIDPIYLKKSSDKKVWKEYTTLTGKILWWEEAHE